MTDTTIQLTQSTNEKLSLFRDKLQDLHSVLEAGPVNPEPDALIGAALDYAIWRVDRRRSVAHEASQRRAHMVNQLRLRRGRRTHSLCAAPAVLQAANEE